MSIRPVNFPSSGDLIVWHDEFNHGGTIAAADIKFAKDRAGADLDTFIVLNCPVPGCGSQSIHPIGGGADPERVQAMFALKYRTAKAMTWDQAVAAVEAAAENMDGPGRARIGSKAEADLPGRRGP